MREWFVSDLHWGHTNILKFEPEYRPYESIQHHDKMLQEAWNDTVGPDDRVWVLGDVFMNKHALKWVAGRGGLRGNKRLVLGNHDKLASQAYLDFGFSKLYGVTNHGHRRVVLSHAPIMLPPKGRWTVNIHGHTHSRGSPTARHFCVSVEANVKRFGEPRPVLWEELEAEISAAHGADWARTLRGDADGERGAD